MLDAYLSASRSHGKPILVMNGPDALTVDLEGFCALFQNHGIVTTVRDAADVSPKREDCLIEAGRHGAWKAKAGNERSRCSDGRPGDILWNVPQTPNS
jgi:hypothetical protein